MAVATDHPADHATRVLPRVAAMDVRRLRDGGDWPRTTRVLPWSIAAFLVVLWIIPFQATSLPISLPFDFKLDRVLLLVIAVLWLAAMASDDGIRPRLRLGAVAAALTVFVAIALASVILQADVLSRLDELEFALKKGVLLLAYGVFFILVSSIVRPSEVTAFVALMVGLACITALGTIYEFRTDLNLFYSWADKLPGFRVGSPPVDPRFGRELVNGPAGHAIAVAAMLAMALPFALTRLISLKPGDRRRWLYIGAVGIILAGCFATIRKTGAVAPGVALLVLVLYRPMDMWRLVPFGIAMVLAIQFLIAPGAVVRIKAQLVTAQDSRSTIGRTEDYASVAPDIQDKPLLGRGHGSYDPSRYRFLDNEYLGRIVETGFIGLASYLALIFAAALVAHRVVWSRSPSRAPPAVAIVAAVAAFAVANAVFDALSFAQAPYLFFFVAALATVLAQPQAALPTPGLRRASPVPIRFAGPDLSVVIVTHNGRELALSTIVAARAATLGLHVQWLVVDSGSTDGTPEAIEQGWPDIVVLRRDNDGFAAANNWALPSAVGRWVLLLNPDAEVVEGSFAELIAALDARPAVGVASVVQQDGEGRRQASLHRFPSVWRQFAEAVFAHRLVPAVLQARVPRGDEERRCDWLTGAFLIVRREALEEVGGLDERFFLYSEEKDWCRRFAEHGWEVRHLPCMGVVHHCGGYDRPELRAQLSWAKLLYARKHFGPRRAGALRHALVLGHRLRIAGLAIRWMGGSLAGQDRLRAERLALAVVREHAPPPFGR